jgi:hypothetical protein
MVTPSKSNSNGVFAQLVRDPNQAKCCNHALIPICHTPTMTTKIFHLFLEGQNPRISMGPSTYPPFPYAPPCDRWL